MAEPSDVDQDGAEWVQTPGWQWVPDNDRERRIYHREMGRRAAAVLAAAVMAGLTDYARTLEWR